MPAILLTKKDNSKRATMPNPLTRITALSKGTGTEPKLEVRIPGGALVWGPETVSPNAAIKIPVNDDEGLQPGTEYQFSANFHKDDQSMTINIT